MKRWNWKRIKGMKGRSQRGDDNEEAKVCLRPTTAMTLFEGMGNIEFIFGNTLDRIMNNDFRDRLQHTLQRQS